MRFLQMHAFFPAKRRKTSLVAILCLLLIVVGNLVYIAWWRLTASRTYVMGRVATKTVEDYVRAHNGRWPKSWAELEKVNPSLLTDDGPQTIKTLQNCVHVDFDVDPGELANQRVDQFQALRPIGPCFPDYLEYWDVECLLDTLKEFSRTLAGSKAAFPQ